MVTHNIHLPNSREKHSKLKLIATKLLRFHVLTADSHRASAYWPFEFKHLGNCSLFGFSTFLCNAGIQLWGGFHSRVILDCHLVVRSMPQVLEINIK